MKKIALTSLLAVFAISSANAGNYFVGGAANLTLNDEHANVVSVAPEIGWHYNDNWDFGAGVNFGYQYDSPDFIGSDIDEYNYGVSVFARYKVAEMGGFKLLLKGAVGAGFTTYSDANDSETAIGMIASVTPMVTYDVSEAFTLYANLNFLGVTAGYIFENKDLGIDSGWNVNAFANSNAVANTGNFQIGFLYNF